MVIQMLTTQQYNRGYRDISCYFKDRRQNNVIASATTNIREPVTLRYGEESYVLLDEVSRIKRYPWTKPYPDSMHTKNMLGFRMVRSSDGKDAITAYRAAMTIEKKGLRKRNIGLTIYGYQGKPYGLARVGFRDEPFYWQVLLDEEGNTAAVFKRHSETENTDCRVTIYVEDEAMLELALLVATDAFVGDIYVDNDGGNLSAGPYTSRYPEEQALLDRSFVTRAEIT